MFLFYVAFLIIKNWNLERVTCYLHDSNLNNKCEPEIIEDIEQKFYKVNFMNDEAVKQKK